ncbi:hypothetical protein BGW37DRAFT_486435 [Umbelopsis sp. PMI_123]|nr:hypothetical protein BGW37DRAFT_486435 [Umbelopsis sp. PMI_123]
MPLDQHGPVLPTVNYPSFLKSTRPYPSWHKVVHHTYVFIFFILVVVLPILHALLRSHRPTSRELWAIFGTLLGVYILYRCWLYFVYQGGYDPTPAFLKTQPHNASNSRSQQDTNVPNRYPTLASLRQDQIAAFMPSTYPTSPSQPPRTDVAASPPPIYQNAIHDTPVPEYSRHPSNQS